MISTRLTCFAALVVLGLAAPAPCHAGSPLANAYFQVRDRALLIPSPPPPEMLTLPDRFAGRLLEVRGSVRGTSSSGSEADSPATLLIGPDNAVTLPVSVLPDKRRLYPALLEPGSALRALCQVVKITGSASGALELVVAVPEHEALAVDTNRARAAEEVARKRAESARASGQRLASRGVYGGRRGRRRRPRTPSSEQSLLDQYANAVRYFNRRLTVAESRTIAVIIIHYSRGYGLDARLVMAVIACESNFNSGAVSRAGAMGLGQLMPGTANDLGVSNPFDLQQNLAGSTRLLRTHLVNMSADGRPTEEAIRLALACYNAGAGAVRKYRGIPPYRETQAYVVKITRLYRQFCGFPTE
jgi:soluble lytic murein transglycosylase-like protein